VKPEDCQAQQDYTLLNLLPTSTTGSLFAAGAVLGPRLAELARVDAPGLL
jgi:hypothetical protein